MESPGLSAPALRSSLTFRETFRDIQRHREFVTSVVKLVMMSSIAVPMVSVLHRGSFSDLCRRHTTTMLHHTNFRLLSHHFLESQYELVL